MNNNFYVCETKLVNNNYCFFSNSQLEGYHKCSAIKVYMTQNFFISLFARAFKIMKNGVYFIVIAPLVAELFKILICAN